MPAATGVYAQPIVLQNHAPAETRNQILDSIEYLNSVMDDAFGQISQMIGQDRTRLQRLNERVAKAQNKVTRISKYKARSTTVHSLSKYPARPETTEHMTLTTNGEMSRPQRKPYELTLEQRHRKVRDVSTRVLFQSLTGAGKSKWKKVDTAKEGLGRLPPYLKTISSCLLFNTNENPYRKYASMDNLEGKEGTDREKIEEQLALAPQTIVDGVALPEFQAHELGYQPEFNQGNLPQFNFNANLSFAGGTLATDIAFDQSVLSKNGQSAAGQLAPSANLLGGLPSAADLQFNIGSAPVGPAITPGPGPPPPPPPAPAPPRPSAPVQAKPTGPAPRGVPAPAAKADEGVQRNALLDAIRNPKKAQRKRAEGGGKSNKKGKKKKRGKAKEPPPMSVMDMLKQRLKERARATGGRKKKKKRKTRSEKKADDDDDDLGISKLAAFRSAQNYSEDENEEDGDEWED